ncbi:TPA: hypothetical protein ACPSKB_003041 [Legionella feeleii]|uniref:Uncharacterized protein n=1 Tax=Legionella feeleii TaxID=453 RepID=A0A378IUT6_9GAMM|nr:hypothetical protein [Legionella feeleii]STX38987.1 Uncharacterised protein [Legionella feeleii]
MQHELFEQQLASFNNLWNTAIVPFFEKFLASIAHFDPRRDTIMRGIERTWTNYVQLHVSLERNILFQFKNEKLTQTQVKFINGYLADMKKSLQQDQQILRQAINDRKHALNYPLPMPTLEEQIEAHQIFPDNPAYYKPSF